MVAKTDVSTRSPRTPPRQITGKGKTPPKSLPRSVRVIRKICFVPKPRSVRNLRSRYPDLDSDSDSDSDSDVATNPVRPRIAMSARRVYKFSDGLRRRLFDDDGDDDSDDDFEMDLDYDDLNIGVVYTKRSGSKSPFDILGEDVESDTEDGGPHVARCLFPDEEENYIEYG